MEMTWRDDYVTCTVDTWVAAVLGRLVGEENHDGHREKISKDVYRALDAGSKIIKKACIAWTSSALGQARGWGGWAEQQS